MERERGVFDKYISRVLGKLSVPKMQNSIKLRLKMKNEEPAKEQKNQPFVQHLQLSKKKEVSIVKGDH